MPDIRDTQLLLDTLRISSRGDPGVLSNRWAAADAEALVRLAEYEGVVLWLHRRLKILGIALTPALREQLSAAAKKGAAHCLGVDAETARTLAILDGEGIVAVPLKAAAMRRISARVPYADARVPVDVDILCRQSDAQRAWDALVASGYTQVGPSLPNHHHLAPVSCRGGVSVEIHLTTVAEVKPQEAWRRATYEGVTVRSDGRSIPIPSDTELLWHSVAHAMVTADLGARFGSRLRYWLDAAALLASDAPIDWERIRARIESGECAHGDIARAWLLAAANLAGRALPHGALGPVPVQPLNLARLLAWRLAVLSRTASTPRWNEKLLEEGARGELRLPISAANTGITRAAHGRFTVASRAARLWWNLTAG